MWLTENVWACSRIYRQPQQLWLARDILHLPQGVFDVFVLWLTPTTGLIRLIRLIRGRTSQLIQDGANEAEGLFRYFKRSPKEYSAWWASRPIWNKNNYSADSFHPSHSFRSPYVISYIIIRGRCLCCVLQAEEWIGVNPLTGSKTKTGKTPWRRWRAMPCCYTSALVL